MGSSFSAAISSPPFSSRALKLRAFLFDRAVCAAAGLVAFVVYVGTLAPGVTGEDSGELLAAGWFLGIPHPPGYPLWCLAAYPVMHLIDFGSVAWRGNLVSAIFGGAGVWLVAETVLTLFGRRGAALVAGLVLAFSKEYWQQSVITEVYTLGAALVALHLLLLARWSRSRGAAMLYAAALVAGIAAAHYTLSLVLVPLMLVYVFCADLRPRRTLRYLSLALLTLPGWLIYLYLPLRSMADPPMDWGNPETWQSFADVVSRGQYRDLFLGPPRSLPWLIDRLRVFAPVAAWEFTPWIGSCAIAGMVVLWRRDRAFAAYTIAAFIALFGAALAAPNLPLEYHWIWISTAYSIPAYVFAALGAGAFLAGLQERTRFPRPVLALVALVLIASPLYWNFRENNRRGDRVVAGYAGDLLEGMAPGAIYFGGGDHTVFPAVYLQAVEGSRPDVLLANRYGYPAPEVYALAGEVVPGGRPSEAEEQRLFEALFARTARPIYTAVPREAPGTTRVNEGLLYRYLRQDEARRDATPIPAAPPDLDLRGDWSNELVAHEYFAARARALFDADRPAEALEALDQAARLVHGDKNALNNLGLNAAEGGQTGAASVYFRRALESDPLFLPAALNLARCYLLQGTPEEAIKLMESLQTAGVFNPLVEETKGAALDARDGH
jgi:tetratricopeptide (TPR) repeat protein